VPTPASRAISAIRDRAPDLISCIASRMSFLPSR
jgi:hypothetical protein